MRSQITLLLILIGVTLSAQDLHVSIAGNDGNAGTETQPWRHIQYAMDNAVPGTTVFVHQGTYNEALSVNVDGIVGAWITFRAFNTDEVVVDGTGISGIAILEMQNVNYVAVEGLKFQNNAQLDAIGIRVEGACSNVRIANCEVSNINFSNDPNAQVNANTNAQGIIVLGTELIPITGLEIHSNAIFNCRLGFSEALAINGNVEGFTLSNNVIHDVTNIGIDVIGHEGTCQTAALDRARLGLVIDNETYYCISPYATAAGIYVDGGSDIIIERNRVHHNQWGIEIGCEAVGKTTDNVIVRNNFIYANATAGIACGGYDFPNTGAVNNTIVTSNTLYGNDTENAFTGEIYLSYVNGLVIANNIIRASNANAQIISDENLATPSQNTIMSSNIWYHSAGENSVSFSYQGQDHGSFNAFGNSTGFTANSVFADPLLVAVGAAPDLHISSGSPAENYASVATTGPGEFDIDGGQRIVGTGLDLGADEIGGAISVGEIGLGDFVIYPNPLTDVIVIGPGTGEVLRIKLFDQRGGVVLDRTIQAGRMLSTAGLATGEYVLVIIGNNGQRWHRKVIKP